MNGFFASVHRYASFEGEHPSSETVAINIIDSDPQRWSTGWTDLICCCRCFFSLCLRLTRFAFLVLVWLSVGIVYFSDHVILGVCELNRMVRNGSEELARKVSNIAVVAILSFAEITHFSRHLHES